MPKYRTKPGVVEAIPILGDVSKLEEFAGNDTILGWSFGYVLVRTPEGEMRGNAGDYLVKNVKGEVYPFKKDIFEMTYEPVGAE